MLVFTVRAPIDVAPDTVIVAVMVVFPVAFKEPVTVVFPTRPIPKALVIPVNASDC